MEDSEKVIYMLAGLLILQTLFYFLFLECGKGEIIRYWLFVYRKIKKINKQKNPIYVNEMFKKGLKIWETEVSKFKFLSYIVFLIFIIYVTITIVINWNYLLIDKKNRWLLISFFMLNFFINLLIIFIIFILPKKLFKKVYKLLENWHFSKEKLFFDKEYTNNNEKVTGDFCTISRGNTYTSYSEMRKKFNSKDISWYYVLIWGLHFPKVEKIIYSPNHKDVYQEFVNLLHEQNN